MLLIVKYVLIHWAANSYQTVCVLNVIQFSVAAFLRLMSTTKLDSTPALFRRVALIQCRYLSTFMLTSPSFFQPRCFSFCSSFLSAILRSCKSSDPVSIPTSFMFPSLIFSTPYVWPTMIIKTCHTPPIHSIAYTLYIYARTWRHKSRSVIINPWH